MLVGGTNPDDMHWQRTELNPNNLIGSRKTRMSGSVNLQIDMVGGVMWLPE